MKLTLHKVPFCLELLRSSQDFVTVEAESGELSEAHKAILDERLLHMANHPDDFIEWKVFRAQLDEKA